MAYLQHSNFTQCHFSDGHVVLSLEKAFDGHHLAGLSVLALEHQPVRAFADHAQGFVLFHGAPGRQRSWPALCTPAKNSFLLQFARSQKNECDEVESLRFA